MNTNSAIFMRTSNFFLRVAPFDVSSILRSECLEFTRNILCRKLHKKENQIEIKRPSALGLEQM